MKAKVSVNQHRNFKRDRELVMTVTPLQILQLHDEILRSAVERTRSRVLYNGVKIFYLGAALSTNQVDKMLYIK